MTTTRFDTESQPLPQRIAVDLNKVGLALKLKGSQVGEARGLSPLQAQILAMLTTTRGRRASRSRWPERQGASGTQPSVKRVPRISSHSPAACCEAGWLMAG